MKASRSRKKIIMSLDSLTTGALDGLLREYQIKDL